MKSHAYPPAADGSSPSSEPVRLERAWMALAGALAAGVSLATAEVAAAVVDDSPSLVIAVADVFVDETPSGIVEWSIDTLGSTQQTLLVWGVVLASVAIGAVVAVAARRNPSVPIVGFIGFGLVGAWAAARNPGTSPALAVLVSAVAALIGLGALWAMTGSPASSRSPQPVAGVQPSAERQRIAPSSNDRRRFLGVAAGAAAWIAVGAFASRVVRNQDEVELARDELTSRLARADIDSLVDDDMTLNGVDGIPRYLTPNDDFYLIDTALRPPLIDVDDWTLRIHGMVDEEIELTFDDLLAMQQSEEIITLSCVSNEIGGELVGNAHWSGVRLDALLRRAGVVDGADQIVGRSVDGWTAGFPTGLALDGRPALVALTMNGAPLPIDHGFPARLVVPGLYGYVSATKWLSDIELTTWDAFDGYWIERGWAKEGIIRTQSRIDVPRSGAVVPAGEVVLAGVAWAPHRGIRRVEVSIDEGPWLPAELNDQITDNSWRQWVLRTPVDPGDHVAVVRATDDTGDTQTPERRSPIPSGATGWHSRIFVAA